MTAFPDFALAGPELLLAAGALLLLLIGAYGSEKRSSLVSGLSVLLLLVAAVAVVIGRDGSTFGGAFVVDGFARFLKVLVLIGSAVAVVMTQRFAVAEKFFHFELPVLIVLATIGMLLMISAGDLIAVYLGLELQSLALYVVASFHRDDGRSTEAGLKYFVLGALSSGMLLYGASLIYGFTGHVDFAGIAAAAAAGGSTSLGLTFGIVFVATGIAFKVSAVPFHMWTPDVYEGAPTPVTAFFAAAPKIAAMALFVRVVMEALGPVKAEWQQIVAFMSLASMILGAFAAIGQRNIKRLMAYSSIGHMGYALVGLAAGSEAGIYGILIYLATYLAMTAGAFAVILSMRRDGAMTEDIESLAGLSRTNPTVAYLLGIIMFSLAGIPPFAGFFGKYFVFAAAINAGLYWLAVIGILSSVVGAYYYLRIVKIMFLDEPKGAFEPMGGEMKAVLGISGLFVAAFALVLGPLGDAALAAARTLF
ncbi:NADH-quinone oxidoreductase subunit NuoN [Pleomorphomonas diazotrophica]|uniref:NADH-quinone oxidoreductase subunit N n=1 Tax=Pleomorphomonas diazotrophica TaxID=1166257 RepID=A0A1I4Q3P8_9HYPH|nr:NADH-quinone oxidoreductase subunit NuoN [Pleomorphomonas diazotrophica]PKR90986.1 NADH-quinone oxidoreductase subunit NuoN [Pleomorphomonas diazotrophica]SFM34270.1 NADH dehydrogenase subunit N [Pleomorphomonas diazotrophica]